MPRAFQIRGSVFIMIIVILTETIQGSVCTTHVSVSVAVTGARLGGIQLTEENKGNAENIFLQTDTEQNRIT